MATLEELLGPVEAADQQAPTYVPPQVGGIRPEGGFIPSFKKTVGQTIKGVGQFASDVIPGVTPQNPVSQYGQEVIDANPTAVNELGDIIPNPVKTVTEAVGNALPSVGGMLGVRALGQGITALSPLTGLAAPVVAGLGQAVSWGGPALLAALPSYGGIRGEQITASPDAEASGKDKLVAMLGAGAVGVIEQKFGLEGMAKKASTAAGRAALAKTFAGDTLLKRVAKGAGKGALEEGGEELVQNPIEQASAYQNPLTPENLKETAFGGVMGAVGGGVLGGGFGAMGENKVSPETAAKDSAQAQLLKNATGNDHIVEDGKVVTPEGQDNIPVEEAAKKILNGEDISPPGVEPIVAPPAVITRDNGDTFTSPQEGVDRIRALGLNPDAYEITEDPAGGFVAQPVQVNQELIGQLQARLAQEQAAPTPDTAYIEELNKAIAVEQGVQNAGANRTGEVVAPAVDNAQGITSGDTSSAVTGEAGADVTGLGTGRVQGSSDQSAVGLGKDLEAPLFSQQDPEEKATIEQTVKSVDSSAQYLGVDDSGLHYFNHVLANGKEATFNMQGDITPEAVKTKLNEVRTRFGEAPLKSEAEPKEFKQIDTYFDGGRKDLGGMLRLVKSAGLEKEVNDKVAKVLGAQPINIQTGAIKVGGNTFRSIVESVVAEQRKAGKFTATKSTTKSVANELKTFLKKGYDSLVKKGKVNVVQSMEQLHPSISGFLKMVAWHGTPHSFDKFSMSKLGTGEGVQAFGHGLYFAGQKSIAEYYKKSLTQNENFITLPGSVSLSVLGWGSILSDNVRYGRIQPSKESYIKFLSDNISRLEQDTYAYANKESIAAARELRSMLEDGSAKPNTPGKLYQVELAPKEEEYLLWDKPLSEQSEVVKKALRGAKLLNDYNPITGQYDAPSQELGKDLYKGLSKEVGESSVGRGSKQAASDYLHSISIRGNKYLDGTSRGKGEGNYNYVIFSDEDIKIQAIYSKNGKIAGAYDPTTKKVWLVADTIKPGDAEYVMRHEAVHALLREDKIFMKQRDKILTDFEALKESDESVKAAFLRVPIDTGLLKGEGLDSLPKAMKDKIAAVEAKGDKYFTARVKTEAVLRALTPERRAKVEELRREEALAYWIQKPENKIKGMWKRLVAAVRAALVRMGMDVKAFTKEDLSALFSQGTQAWARQGGTTLGGEKASPLMSMASPEDIINAVNEGTKKNYKRAKEAFFEAGHVLKDPRHPFYNVFIKHAKNILGFAPLSFVREIWGKSIPYITNVSKHANTLEALANRLQDDFMPIYKAAISAGEKLPGGVKTINNAFLQATWYQMSPGLSEQEQGWWQQGKDDYQSRLFTEKNWKEAGMLKSTGKTFSEAYKEAKAAYDRLGKDGSEAKKAYHATVDYLVKLRSIERDTALAFINRTAGDDAALKEDLLKRFAASFSTLKGDYVPLTRYGKFTFTFINSEGDSVTYQRETPGEIDDLELMARADGANEKTFSRGVLDDARSGAVSMPQELINKLLATIEAKYTAGIDPSDEQAMTYAKESAQNAVSDFNQELYRWLPDTAALKNSIRRKNVQGASAEMLQSATGYVQRHAKSIAWSQVGRQIDNEIRAFSEDNKELAKAAKEGEGAQDLVMRGHLLTYMRLWYKAIQSEHTGPIAAFIGKMTTAFMMTSPSSFLVQLTQLPALTLPHLAVKYGLGKSTMALKRGLQKAFNKKYSKEAMYGNAKVNEAYNELHRTVKENEASGIRGVGDDWYSAAQQEDIFVKLGKETDGKYLQELLTLREAEARNKLDISVVHEVYDIQKGKEQTAPGKLFNLGMMPMKYGELASRKAAILAAFELAQGNKQNFFSEGDKEGIIDSISGVVNKTLFNFGKNDKGWIMQKSILRVPFTFQTFRIKTMLHIGILAARSFARMQEGLTGTALKEAQQERNDARKELVGVMGMSAILGGAQGALFSSLVFAVASMLFGDKDDPYDAKLEFYQWLEEMTNPKVADILSTGAASAVGVNISRRVGFGDTFGFQSSPPEGLHGADLAAWYAGSLIGPSFSVAQGAFKGYDEMSKGNYMKGLEVATPKPIKDVLKAIRIATDGLKNSGGRKLLPDEEITAADVVLVALGFSPSEIARVQAEESSMYTLGTKLKERRSELSRAAAQAILESGNIDAVKDDIMRFVEKSPEAARGIGDSIKDAVRKNITGEAGIPSRRDRALYQKYGIERM